MQYLSSFKPLTINKHGRKAIKDFGLPPFVDCSCRREPDFESKYPSISAICHAGNFAPRLFVGDVVIFITVKRKYSPLLPSHWRLVAILKVINRFESHREAANWYKTNKLHIPNNCIVEGNPPLSLDKTTGPIPSFKRVSDPAQIVRIWDKKYEDRVNKHGTFLACEAEFLDLYKPPVLTEEQLLEIFGKIPGTLNPPQILENQLKKIRDIATKR